MKVICATDIFPDNRFAPHARYAEEKGVWWLEYSETKQNEDGEIVVIWHRSKLIVLDEEYKK